LLVYIKPLNTCEKSHYVMCIWKRCLASKIDFLVGKNISNKINWINKIFLETWIIITIQFNYVKMDPTFIITYSDNIHSKNIIFPSQYFKWLVKPIIRKRKIYFIHLGWFGYSKHFTMQFFKALNKLHHVLILGFTQ